MKCFEFVELVTDTMEGSASVKDRVRFRWHRIICEPCRRYLHQMETTSDLLQHLPEPRIDSTALEALRPYLDHAKDTDPWDDPMELDP